MKVGDLIRIQADYSFNGDIGIVTHLWDNGDVDVLFHDGEFQMNSYDLEVINEGR
jgi:hypothetical protein